MINVEIILVRGNHDQFSEEFYQNLNIEIYNLMWCKKKFCFVHDIQTITEANSENYFFSGHIHPGIKIAGPGKQSVTLPCFYIGQEVAILPAFGNFTGMVNQKIKKGDHVFGITNQEVIKLP